MMENILVSTRNSGLDQITDIRKLNWFIGIEQRE